MTATTPVVSNPATSDGPGRRVDRHKLVRRHNQRIVFETVLTMGELTRVEIASHTGLSKPTVNVLIDELEKMTLVRQVGQRIGPVGRSPVLYAVNPQACAVVAIDVGAQRIRGGVSDLFGEVLMRLTMDVPRKGDVLDLIAELARSIPLEAGLASGATRVVVVSTPGFVDRSTGRLSLAQNVRGLTDLPLANELSQRLGIEVVVDNDVNLAALGERRRGCARDHDNFVFLSVGNGVGLGSVVNGELLRGSRGAAGEIGYLPLGPDAFDERTRRRGGLEEAAGASGIRAAARELHPHFPGTILSARPTVEQVFSAAEQGDPLGVELVEREGRLLALAALSVMATLDPELIVLGGGVGGNQLLVEPVRRFLAEVAPYPVAVRTSELEESASLFGALAVGLDRVRAMLLAE